MNKRIYTAIMTALLVLLMAGSAMCATYDSNVTLENKDSYWNLILDDDITAFIEYNSVGEEFAWHVDVTAAPTTEYSLIYYADYTGDRFGDWGGDNPGALIIAFTTDPSGDFDDHGYTELNMDLPCAPDANMAEHDYSGAPDFYTNAHGAKLWMVLSDDYDAANSKMTGYNPTQYLFETDLITYTDCDEFYPGAPPVATFYVGDAFNGDTLPIMVLNATNAGSVDVTLTYDASLVTVTVTDGDMDSMFYNIGTGQVRIGAYQTNNPGLDGDFVLANVAFAPTSVNGSCDFTIAVTTYKDATPCGRSMPYDVSTGVYCSYDNGDVNGDGDVDMFDAMYLAKHTIEISGFEDIVECAAEVSGDGVLDIADAGYLARHVLEITGFETLR